MVLVDAVRYRAVPECSSPDLGSASVPLDHQEIAAGKAEPFELPLEELDSMNIAKIQALGCHVGDAQERIDVLHGRSFALLLNSSLDCGHVGERYVRTFRPGHVPHAR